MASFLVAGNNVRKTIPELKMPTSDPLRPRIYDEGGSWKRITESLSDKDTHVSPLMARTYGHFIHIINTTLRGCGKVFMTKSLPLLMNIHVEGRKCTSPGVLFDIVLLTPDKPVTFLTVTSAASETVDEYNWLVANKLLHAIRRYSDERVSIAHGVIQENELTSENELTKVVDDIIKKSTTFANPASLTMSKPKLDKLYKSVVSAMVIEKRVEFDSKPVRLSNDLHVISPPVFSAVLKYIDTPRVKVTGSFQHVRDLMIEVARRLERNGKTVLVFRNSDMKRGLSRLNICSYIDHQEGFKQTPMPQKMSHMVVEVHNETDLPETRIRGCMWVFVTGTKHHTASSDWIVQLIPGVEENEFDIEEVQ